VAVREPPDCARRRPTHQHRLLIGGSFEGEAAVGATDAAGAFGSASKIVHDADFP
jgi:hypothetical protein